MDYMSPNNMPPVVSPAATHGMPNMMPNMMPHVNVVDVHQKNVTENIYMYPYPKKPVYNDFALVLVLFILLVIILRGVHHHHGGKC